ncbi:SDR family NAD(P)-dependent oxidoreductase [Blastomonas sp. SL216]|uniref:SDR family NAD(P)-dependent oxidoreductase n=1 Tax=Blastomonas sp. SL216 TaxID=2995169 RepID=UPI002377AB70|nr:SDR family NAD(P)-dependent oxidoreductase [Blastomonas sp. SL216]
MTDKVLQGQLALVTGASRGIGAATARALATRGAHVILTARTAKDLEGVEDAIFEAGGTATIAPLDLTDGDSIARLAAAISGRWEALDILVLNAAMLGSLGPVPTIDGTELNRLMTLNVLSAQAMIAHFDPMLRKSSDARVVALTSSVAASPRAFWGAYGASKAALEVLLSAYGEEMRNIGKIRTAIVDPARTRTAMRAKAYPGEDPATVKLPEVVGEAIADLVSNAFETGTKVVLEG